MPGTRLLSAFAAAAVVATLVIGVSATISFGTVPVEFLISVAIIACGVTAVIGVPAFLITRSWDIKSIFGYGAIGVVVSLCPAWLLQTAYPEFMLTVATVVAGFFAGLVFGFIVTRPLTFVGAEARRRLRGASGEVDDSE